MGLEFLDRTVKTSVVVLLIFFPFGLYYFGVFPAIAVLSGGAWGVLNLIFTSALVRATVRPGRIDKRRAYGLAFIKFPLLYGSGYLLLKIPRFEPLLLLAGFSILMAVMILKTLARLVVRVPDHPGKENDAQGVV